MVDQGQTATIYSTWLSYSNHRNTARTIPKLLIMFQFISVQWSWRQSCFRKWSLIGHNIALTLNDIIMWDKNWVEIHPRTPDCDIINSPSFYKESKHGPIFKGGKAIVLYICTSQTMFTAPMRIGLSNKKWNSYSLMFWYVDIYYYISIPKPIFNTCIICPVENQLW